MHPVAPKLKTDCLGHCSEEMNEERERKKKKKTRLIDEYLMIKDVELEFQWSLQFIKTYKQQKKGMPEKDVPPSKKESWDVPQAFF